MSLREPLKDKEYFEYAMADCLQDIEQLRTYINTKDERIPNWSRIYSSLYGQLTRLVYFKYSMGHPVSEIATVAKEAINNYLLAENHPNAEDDKFNFFIGVYESALEMVSFAILFDVDSEKISQLKTTFDKTKGKDKLLDLLISTQIPIKPISEKIQYPKQYTTAISIFEVEHSKKLEALKNYIETWYPTMKKMDWYNAHKNAKVGGSSYFKGYWSFETAAIVKALQLDDTNIKNLAYYPKDIFTS